MTAIVAAVLARRIPLWAAIPVGIGIDLTAEHLGISPYGLLLALIR